VLAIFIFVVAHRGSADVKPDGVAIVGSLIGVAILSYSGWLGGTLVYRNQIGVDHRYANAGTWRERTLDSFDRPVCNTSELAPGQMMLAIVKGERIAVGRCETGIAAFSDHCTHRGGPLSDGSLVGCTVQCPWHGSNFDVYTGRVVAGPAEQRIETYQIDVRNNEVYVIPKRHEAKKAA
jgi:nitrite reductase/ring-hydroxylating ferredoxin subunit